MQSQTRARRARLFFPFLLVLGIPSIFAACVMRDDDRDREPSDCPSPRATCIIGQQVSCPCADGTTGIQSCNGSGAFGLCQCSGVSDAGDAKDAQIDGDANARDAAPD
jgi:hypothetical protein